MQITLIGDGAIARYVTDALHDRGITANAVLMRPERLARAPAHWIGNVADVPSDTNLVVDCAGHSALRSYGPDILAAGYDLLTVSIGALADAALADQLTQAARGSGATLHLASGAIGALDTLRAGAVGALHEVRYIGRKPPAGWRGSAAEDTIDLDALTSGSAIHFEGTARDAALTYPKNANVAAAVALAGVGFDATQVRLIADADAGGNIHEIHARGGFGSFEFRITGATLPDNPRTSALAAMSTLSAILERGKAIRF